ncbi:hypothetical protein PR048_010826 [Dryococelus australis]|uniref:Transposase n=1 Tax=Dryococelus australis TaxID=614101 RepID=A0ABQ9I4U9_9NEOP|nr:hypothetical protein PR048_010826 [Dryococelus australis]
MPTDRQFVELPHSGMQHTQQWMTLERADVRSPANRAFTTVEYGAVVQREVSWSSTLNAIGSLYQRARESGQIIPGQGVIRGRQPYRHTTRVEERVRQMFARNLSLSSLPDGACGCSAIHRLMEGDRHCHFEYCQRILTLLQQDPDTSWVTYFRRTKHSLPAKAYLIGTTTTIGIKSGYLVSGTVSVAGHTHCTDVCDASARDSTPELLGNISLAVRRVMWYQHDGVTHHYSGAARRELDHISP